MKRPETLVVRRFDGVGKRPAGYEHCPSLPESELSSPDFHRIHDRAWRLCEGSQWFFPNQSGTRCKLAFDFVLKPEFGAAAWYDPSRSTHWILLHRTTVDQLRQFFASLFSVPMFLKSIGSEANSPETATMRSVALYFALDFLFHHEWMHIVLGHTALEAGAKPLSAMLDALRDFDTYPESFETTVKHSEERRARERAADFFASVGLAQGCWRRHFLFLDKAELPQEQSPRTTLYMSFLGAVTVLVYFAASGFDDAIAAHPYYPTLRARLTTLFHGFTIVADQHASSEDWPARLLTAVIRDLQAGLKFIPGSAGFAHSLIAAMDDDLLVEAALAEVRELENKNELILPIWSPYCVAAASWK
jgi:hypothetical protein